MKRIKFLIVIFLMLHSFNSALASIRENRTFPVIKIDCSEEPIKPDEPLYHRKTFHNIEASISLNGGVEIPGIDTADIISYEICSGDGEFLASFADEAGFIDFIFSSTGLYGELRK